MFPIMVSHLIRQVGFGWAMRVSAFLMLFLLVVANLTVRPFQPPHPNEVSATQLRKPFTEVDFLLVTAGAFCFSYGFFVPINYLPLQALEAGISPNLTQYLLPILNAASLFGRLSAGFASDKFGPYNVFVAVCYLSGIWILGLWLPIASSTTTAGVVAFAVLFGFSSAAYVSLLAHLVMAISPMNFADIGWRTGVVLFVTAVGGFTTNPINGAILSGDGGWTGLKVFSGVFCIAGTTFVLAVRIRRGGRRFFVKV